jgi:hypothetical protein
MSIDHILNLTDTICSAEYREAVRKRMGTPSAVGVPYIRGARGL